MANRDHVGDVLGWTYPHARFSLNLCVALLPSACGHAHGERLDVAGAVTVTASLMLAVYAVVNGNEAGRTSAQTLGLLCAALALLAVFLATEARVQHPLMPLGLFRLRNLASLAAARSDAMRSSASATAALNSGYHMAFLLGAIFAATAGVLGGLLLRRGQSVGAGAQPAAGSDDVTTARPTRTTINAAAAEHQ